MLRLVPTAAFALCLISGMAEARVVRLRIDRREVLLEGRGFGLAGPYEKLSGQVDFALDPEIAANRMVVDLSLAPRNENGEVEFHADFYLLKPVDPARGNGVLLYEAGNRGSITDSALRLVQKRFILVEDLPEIVSRARAHYRWATRTE